MFWNKNKKGGFVNLKRDEILIKQNQISMFLPDQKCKEYLILLKILDDADYYRRKGEVILYCKMLEIMSERIIEIVSQKKLKTPTIEDMVKCATEQIKDNGFIPK